MTILFQKNFHLLNRAILSCLCLVLFTIGLAQDNSETTESTTTDATVETTIETETDSEEVTEVDTDTTTDSEETPVLEEPIETPSSEEETTEAKTASEETDTSNEVASEEISEDTEETTPSNESATSDNRQEDSEEKNTVNTEETGEVENSETSEETSNNVNTAEEELAEDESTETPADNAVNTEDDNERVITIEYSGGNRKASDFRYGPWVYSHPDSEGIIGRVGTDNKKEEAQLTVYAQEAELKAPEDVLIATAGERVASFIGGVRVERNRLTALGEELAYSEATGFGELAAEKRIEITVLPKEDDGDLTEIQANSATFDVDTDVSVSRGDVTLESGSQSGEAEEIIFEEGLDLAMMVSPNGQVTLTRSDDNGELTITADTVRVLTETKKLMASGNVKLVDGAITTTGEIVFFDDEIERAEVFGTPDNLAVSIDSEFDVTLKGERLEQLIDLDLVEILDETAPSIWDEADFLLTSETNN